MKKILLIIAFFWISGLAVVQSQGQGKGERIESLRIAFITRQLQLTPEEAQRFWPVYNNYDNEMRSMMKEHHQKGGSEIELEEKILNMHKKFKPDFLKVITEEKFNKLMVAERTWGEMIRKELQRRRENGGKPMKGPGGKLPADQQQ